MTGRDLYRILVIVGVVIFLASAPVFAAGIVKAFGTLNAIDEDGSVIIDNKGYLMDYGARVLDYKGGSKSLGQLSDRAKVEFEYEQTDKGFVIKSIKEVAQ